jgi:hypothetical protein
MNERDPSCMSTETERQPSVAGIFPRNTKDTSIADVKMEYIHAVPNFIMAESQPFTIVASPEFCSLFRPFHKEADKITDVPPN